MTCQVVLGNGFGVGLASDSAVTVGGRRTYEASEKLYPLPLPHRLAVLHAGYVDFHNLPHGVLIRQWIACLGDVQLRHVEDYRDNYVKWLRDNIDRWTTPESRDDDIEDAVDDYLHDVWREMKSDLEDPGDAEPTQVVLGVIKRLGQELADGPVLQGTDENTATKVAQRLMKPVEDGREGLDAVIEYYFDDVPRSKEIDGGLRALIVAYLVKQVSRGIATLTFVGYGEKEMLPSASQIAIGCALDRDIVRLEHETETANSDSDYALVEFVGQKDGIWRFLTGISDEILDAGAQALSDKFGGTTMEFATNEKDVEEQRSEKLGVAEVFADAARSESMKTLYEPFTRTVGILPLKSLADAARSLVGVQALSQTITANLSTVGGDIDVATITLHEGFRWVSKQA